MAWTPYYKPTFYRHLHHLVINGFYARDVDADDLEFLEYVKHSGSANGSMPSSSAVLIEELGFWHLPYAVAPDVERRIGKKPRVEETPEQRELREARVSRWHAQREIRKQERAIAAVELERERREHEQADARRKVREIISDAEWDAAAPKHAPFGGVIDGKYVPEWKLQELGIAAEQPQPVFPNKRARRAAAEQRANLVQEAIAVRERAVVRKELIAEEARARAAYARERAEKVEQRRREAILKEARDNLARIAKMERKWQDTASPYPTVEKLMDAIVTMLQRTPGQAWGGPEMMRSLGCTDVEMFNAAIDELMEIGRLKKGTP